MENIRPPSSTHTLSWPCPGYLLRDPIGLHLHCPVVTKRSLRTQHNVLSPWSWMFLYDYSFPQENPFSLDSTKIKVSFLSTQLRIALSQCSHFLSRKHKSAHCHLPLNDSEKPSARILSPTWKATQRCPHSPFELMSKSRIQDQADLGHCGVGAVGPSLHLMGFSSLSSPLSLPPASFLCLSSRISLLQQDSNSWLFPREGRVYLRSQPSTCGNRIISFNILQYCPWPVGGKQRNPGKPFKDGLWHFSAEAIFTGYKGVLETFHFRDLTLVGSAGMYGSLFSLLTLCILVAYEEESTENGLFNLKRFKVLQVGWRPERTP